ncbi:DUF6912 family protein [Janibacter sp. GS2]|uniref:DUF6912 family protein n=1 Tax=Janibacter sp. GS2 TaxID=3442646 RepID=UPI003EBBDF6C
MRVYVPLLLDELSDVLTSARLPGRPAHGVTDALRTIDPEAEEEDLEFEAMCQALDTARDLGPGRRVVAAADVPSRADAGDGARLVGDAAILLTDVVSFHVEEGEGAVGSGYDDLLWYDVTELGVLVSEAAR